jgi:hypothetical protein
MLNAAALAQSMVERAKTAWGVAAFPRLFVERIAQGFAAAVVDHLKQAVVSVTGGSEGEGVSYVRSGSATVLALTDSVVVTFASALPDDSYRVFFTPLADPGSTSWVTKTTSGFTLHLASALGASPVSFDWLACYPSGARSKVSGSGTIQ